MGSNQPIAKARSAERCGVSVKLRNAGDGLIWPTEGRFFTPAELRCEALMVSQTKARYAPRQQTGKTGQMIQYQKERL